MLNKVAVETWKKRDPNAEVLATRIPMQDWKRRVQWHYSADTWSKTDSSRIQVYVIVKHDDKLAAIRPVNIWRNHLSNDQISSEPYHDKGEELEPHELIPLAKVK